MAGTWATEAPRENQRGEHYGTGWDETLRNALIAGSIVSVFTIAAVALRGRADSGSAVAPINATTHVVYGPEAGDIEAPDLGHTLPGLAINAGASVLWATVYERLFGGARQPGAVGKSLLGGGVVAALAYLVDYHLVPKRLTPGWEERVSGRSLAVRAPAKRWRVPPAAGFFGTDMRCLLQYMIRGMPRAPRSA